MELPDQARWQRLSACLDELMDLQDGPRTERLRAMRREDALFATELETLLAASDRSGALRFLTGTAGGPARDLPPPLKGQHIGGYALLEPLGQGGSGSVWRARGLQGGQGEVAVKLLHLSLLGRSAAQRFQREGEILRRLSHPCITQLSATGVTELGQPYLVLGLVEGERIDTYCDRLRLDVEQRLALFGQVLSAVAYAHSHLVIHRDIKPTNVLVTRDGEVRLLDFGIAKLIDDADAGASTATPLTHEGAHPMTPEFAAPEQMRGDAVTTATDVYALGVLLYWLLTGRHPLVTGHATARQVEQAVLHDEPAPLTSAEHHGGDVAALAAALQRGTTPAGLKRQLSGDLQNIVAQALQKDPARRYATPEALHQDLQRFLAHQPVSARPDSFAYRCGKFVRRHQRYVALSAALVLSLLAGLAGTVTQAWRAQEQARQARVERDHALQDLAFASAAQELLTFVVSQSSEQALTAAQLLERAEAMADRQFAGDALTRGRLQLALGVEYANVRDMARYKALLLKAEASARIAGNVPLLANADCLLGRVIGEQGEPERAMDLLGEALRRVRAMPTPDTGAVIDCLHARADLSLVLDRPQAALADAQAALALLPAPRPDQRAVLNTLRISAGEAYGRLGQMADAVAAYESALADMAALGLQQTPRTAVRYNNLGRMLNLAGRPRQALAALEQGLLIARGVSPHSELVSILEGHRVRSLIELGRHDEARAVTEQALAAAVQRQDALREGTLALYGAPAWCDSGELTRCAAMLARARDRLGTVLKPAHVTWGVVDCVAAQLSLASGQWAQAGAQLRHAVAVFDTAADGNPLRIRALAWLAGVERHGGDLAQASRHAEQAVAQAREAARGFASTQWLGIALGALAQVRLAQGQGDQARAMQEEAALQLAGALGPGAAPVSAGALIHRLQRSEDHAALPYAVK